MKRGKNYKPITITLDESSFEILRKCREGGLKNSEAIRQALRKLIDSVDIV